MQDIINLIEKSLKVQKVSYPTNVNYGSMIDKDLKEKLSYLLGVFKDKRAENILISLIENNKEGVIYTAIDALARLNSIKSLPTLINLYKNLEPDSLIKTRTYSAIMTLVDNNNFPLLKKIIKEKEIDPLS